MNSAAERVAASSRRRISEVALHQDAAVVLSVAGDHVGHGAGGDGVAAGGAEAAPGCSRKGAEQDHSRGANGAELFNMVRPGLFVGVRVRREMILIEPGKRRFAAASDPKGPESEDAFRVIDMI